MFSKKPSRRGVIRSTLLAGTAACSATVVRALGLTPSAAEGPFYPAPEMRFSDIDNDLVKISRNVVEAGGRILFLKGRLLDAAGHPQEGLRIEIWQTDMNGKYMHPDDTRRVEKDDSFQGFGFDISSADGSYSFRTIRPGKYPGRTEHIHVKILDGTKELLTTQFYEAGNSNNARDPLFRRLSTGDAESVSMVYRNGKDGLEATVDVVLRGR